MLRKAGLWAFTIIGFLSLFFWFKSLYAKGYARAEHFYSQGEYQKAIKIYLSSLTLPCSDQTILHTKIGQCYYQMDQNDKAITEFSKALKLAPDDTDAQIGMADCHYDLGSYPQAIDEYTKSIGLRPKDGELYDYRADAYEALGKNDLARTDRDKALQLGYAPQN